MGFCDDGVSEVNRYPGCLETLQQAANAETYLSS